MRKKIWKDALSGSDAATEAAAVAELEHELAEMGIEFHGSASDNMLNFLQHLNSCIKTHKSTKGNHKAEERAGDDLANRTMPVW